MNRAIPPSKQQANIGLSDAKNLLRGAYLLFLISRTKDPDQGFDNYLWNIAASPTENAAPFAQKDELEQEVRERLDREGKNRFSLTVSSFVVDAILRICEPPIGDEIDKALRLLRYYRDPAGAYGTTIVSKLDGKKSINAISRHTAAALRILVLCRQGGQIDATARWLVLNQRRHNGDGGWAYGGGASSDFYSTAHVAEALHLAIAGNLIDDLRLRQDARFAIDRAMEWLVRTYPKEEHRPGGLWVVNPEKAPERFVMDSSDAIARLSRVLKGRDAADPQMIFLAERVRCLIALLNPDGSFGNLNDPVKGRHCLLANTIQAVEALLEASSCGLDTAEPVTKGLAYVRWAFANDREQTKLLWLSDFTALMCILSRTMSLQLSPDEASELRSVANLVDSPNKFLKKIPPDVQRVFGPTYRNVISGRGGRIGLVGFLQELYKGVPQWVWDFLAFLKQMPVIYAAVAAAVGWILWLLTRIGL